MSLNYKNKNWYHCKCDGKEERLVIEIPENSKEIIYKKVGSLQTVTVWNKDVFYRFLPNYYIAVDVEENFANRLIKEGKAIEVTEEDRNTFQGYFARDKT